MVAQQTDMYARQLDVQYFRTYSYASLSLTPGHNLLIGHNAAGKTSLLEALAFFSLGRSFRAAQDKDVIQFQQTESRIRIVCSTAQRDIELAIKITQKGKQVAVNRVAKKSLSDFLGNVYAITFTPEDLGIIKEGPDERRRFLNLTMSQFITGYVQAVHSYNQLLVKRNHLLKMRQLEALTIWDQQMAEAAVRVITLRHKFCMDLQGLTTQMYSALTESGDVANMQYHTDVLDNSTENPTETLYLALQKSLPQDLQRGFTSVGPHRDDLRLQIDNRSAARFASQGQQRSLVLALKLAVVELIKRDTGEYPILLLDDVLSELDETRQLRLLSLLGNAQTIITTTQQPNTFPSGSAVFRVAHGIIQGM